MSPTWRSSHSGHGPAGLDECLERADDEGGAAVDRFGRCGAIDTVERSDVTAVVDAGDGSHLITPGLRCVAHPGGMIWERPVAWDDVPGDQFVLWSARSLRERLEILLAEADDLVRLTEEDPSTYADLVGDQGHVQLIAEILDDLARMSGRTTSALAADNLGTVLEDPDGVRKIRDDLAAAISEVPDG